MSAIKSKDSLYLLEKDLLKVFPASATHILVMVSLLHHLPAWSSDMTLSAAMNTFSMI